VRGRHTPPPCIRVAHAHGAPLHASMPRGPQTLIAVSCPDACSPATPPPVLGSHPLPHRTPAQESRRVGVQRSRGLRNVWMAEISRTQGSPWAPPPFQALPTIGADSQRQLPKGWEPFAKLSIPCRKTDLDISGPNP
jgi:hypothetical protein